MNDAALQSSLQDIVFDEVFPHAPETIWKVLTTGELIGRWLLPPAGFEPVVGNHFSFQTPPDGEWDGVIRCQVLEIVPNKRLVYSWKSGMQSNAGYVSRLDTLVTWTLSKIDGGTRLHLVHSGFVTPKNDVAYRNISQGWPKVIGKLVDLAGELATAGAKK